jgi:subtilisin
MNTMKHLIRVVAITAGLFQMSSPSLVAQGQSGQVDVLILFKQAPDAIDLAFVRGRDGAVQRTFNIVPAIAARVPARALGDLQNNPRVATVELDGVFTADDVTTELNNTWGVKQIGAGTVQANGNTGLGVKVAVIDSGVNCGHVELAGHCGGGWDFVNNDNNPADDNGHGTHVAGTIAARRDGAGVVGVAPDAQIIPLKVLGANGSGSFSWVIAALDWAVAHDVQVTNNSYGSSSDPGSIVHQAFDRAYAAGIVNIASAGNSGICSGSTNTVGYPGRYTAVLAVAATNINNTRPCWSSTGPDVDISAPGVSINSTKHTGGYVVFNGTSMASPHVVGVAALVIAANPSDTNGFNGVADEVRSILTSTAKDLGVAGKDTLYGYGLVQAVAAVAAVGGGGNPPPPPPPSTIGASSIVYKFFGDGNPTRNLKMTLTVKDSNGQVVPSASVSIALLRNGTAYATGAKTTASNGTVFFDFLNVPTGTYTTKVNGVSKSGYVWDGVTPPNSTVKQ